MAAPTRRTLPSLAVSLVLAAAAPCPADDGPVALFDGKTLDGWRRLGGEATYSVEQGTIVGRTAPGTPNTFLATEATYGDFALELEYRVDPRLNSGVQVRSEVRPDGRVFGYQVEIDPSERAWSAGIYDEARRGWLSDLKENEAARRAFRQNDWNRYRIECVGDRLRTWINGVPAADLVDSMTLEGFIALQVHSFRGEHPAAVRWRNIRLQDLGKHVWEPLWDGKSLAGWSAEGGGEWRVESGELVGSNVQSDARHGHLFLETPLKDFTVRVVYKAVKGNSGVYFRTEKVGGAVGIKGFQAEIDATRDAGGLYETNGRAWVVQPSAEFVAKSFKPGEWNEMTVSAHGRRIVVHVNGRRSAELKDDPGRTEGLLALQLHGSQDMEVRFKSIEILRPAK